MPILTFSLAMCQKLSSLAPGFEGHWWWVKYGSGIELWCTEDFAYFWKEGNGSVLSYKEFKQEVIICPAWQAEDVLRNSHKLFGDKEMIICKKIAWFFVAYQDTAYQKIEEYLWSILKP